MMVLIEMPSSFIVNFTNGQEFCSLPNFPPPLCSLKECSSQEMAHRVIEWIASGQIDHTRQTTRIPDSESARSSDTSRSITDTMIADFEPWSAGGTGPRGPRTSEAEQLFPQPYPLAPSCG